MNTYVATIGGKAVLTFRAVDDDQAHAMIDDQEGSMRSDLKVLVDADGKPLWDGKSAIEVREATAPEHAEWKRSRDQAIIDGEIDLDTRVLATPKLVGASKRLTNFNVAERAAVLLTCLTDPTFPRAAARQRALSPEPRRSFSSQPQTRVQNVDVLIGLGDEQATGDTAFGVGLFA